MLKNMKYKKPKEQFMWKAILKDKLCQSNNKILHARFYHLFYFYNSFLLQIWLSMFSSSTANTYVPYYVHLPLSISSFYLFTEVCKFWFSISWTLYHNHYRSWWLFVNDNKQAFLSFYCQPDNFPRNILWDWLMFSFTGLSIHPWMSWQRLYSQ